MSRSPFQRLLVYTRVSVFPRSARSRDGYNGVSIMHYRAAKEQKHYACIWLDHSKPSDRRPIGGPKLFPSLRPRDDVNLQFKLHFRVSRYNWGPAARRIAKLRTNAARRGGLWPVEVMVRSRFMPNRSREIDEIPPRMARIASQRRVCEVKGRRWPHSDWYNILRPLFDYHIVPQFGRRFTQEVSNAETWRQVAEYSTWS